MSTFAGIPIPDSTLAREATEFGRDICTPRLFEDGARLRAAEPRLSQVLFYPVTDAGLDTGSCCRAADGPWPTREAVRRFWDAHLPDRLRCSEITAPPLQVSLPQLRALAPASMACPPPGAPRRSRGLVGDCPRALVPDGRCRPERLPPP